MALTPVAWAAGPAWAATPPDRVVTVAQQGDGRLPSFVGSAQDAARAADEVLARPEFARRRPNVVQRAQAWIAERLQRILIGLSGGGRGTGVVVAIALAGVMALVFTAVRFGRGFTRNPSRRSRVPTAKARTAADWNTEAEAHERAGRWAAAIRCRHRAMVSALAERGVVEEIAGRTSGEYRRDIAAALPAAAEPASAATALFEAAWYGGGPTGAEEATEFSRLATQVLARRR